MAQSNGKPNIDSALHHSIYTTSNCDEQTIGIDEVDRRFTEHCDNEEIIHMITELDGTKRQLGAERQRVTELEDQLSSLSKCLVPKISSTEFTFEFLTIHVLNL